MKHDISRSKTKRALISSAVVLTVLFAGCSSEKDKETKDKVNVKAATASSIEVSQNSNASQIKVEEKEHNKDNRQYYMDYDIKSEYSLNSMPANKDASVRERPRSAVDANLHVRSPYEKVQISLLVKGLSKHFIVKCSACHNDYANGIIGPSLLGKSSDFIFEKINKFKKDKNANVLMSDLVNNMDEKEIRELADEISNFNNQIKELRNK